MIRDFRMSLHTFRGYWRQWEAGDAGWKARSSEPNRKGPTTWAVRHEIQPTVVIQL